MRCARRRRNAAASSSVRVCSSISVSPFPSQIGLGERPVKAGGEPFRPFVLPGVVGDEVVADLDESVRPAMGGGMPVDTVTGEFTRIGFIGTDDETVLGPKPAKQRLCEPGVGGMQDRDVPWPGRAAAKLRGEGVDRYENRSVARGEQAC